MKELPILRITFADGQFITGTNLTLEAEFSLLKNDSRVKYYGEWYRGESDNPFLSKFITVKQSDGDKALAFLKASDRENINITSGVGVLNLPVLTKYTLAQN